MKGIYKFSRGLLLLFITGIALGFYGCTADEGETEIISKTPDQYKLELSQFVASEKAIVEKCVVGYNKGDFKSSTIFEATRSAYLVVLVAAETALEKPDLTIADIVAVNKTLAIPGKAFVSNLWISDRRPLNDAIVAAEELNTNTPEGTAKGQAPAAAKTAFTDAITLAKTVRGSSITIDRQVTEAVEKLAVAKQIFQNAIVK